MTKAEYLKSAAKAYDKLQALLRIGNLYNYEKGVVGIWQEIGRKVLEKNLGEPVKDKCKKNFTTWNHFP